SRPGPVRSGPHRSGRPRGSGSGRVRQRGPGPSSWRSCLPVVHTRAANPSPNRTSRARISASVLLSGAGITFANAVHGHRAAVSLGAVSILDDARPGMDPAVRPQDDLFGHVNGRWLATEPIPDDRSSWGPFVSLADVAEQQVRDIIEEVAADPEVVAGGATTDRGRIAALYASFMDTATIERRGLTPVRPLLNAVDGLRDVRDLTAFLGEFERMGGTGLFGSYVDTDDRKSDRYLFHLVQGGLGLPDESYYRDEKFAEVREKYVVYLTRLFVLAGHGDPAGAAQTVLDIDTQLAQGHWERAETRDVQKTYNLLTRAELEALAPNFDWQVYVRNLGGDEQTLA